MELSSIIIIIILLIDLWISLGSRYKIEVDEVLHPKEDKVICEVWLYKFTGTYDIDEEYIAPRKEEDVEYKSASFEPHYVKLKKLFKYTKKLN